MKDKGLDMEDCPDKEPWVIEMRWIESYWNVREYTRILKEQWFIQMTHGDFMQS